MTDTSAPTPARPARRTMGWLGWLLLSIGVNVLVTFIVVESLLGPGFLLTRRLHCNSLVISRGGQTILYAGPAKEGTDANIVSLTNPAGTANIRMIGGPEGASIIVNAMGQDKQRRASITAGSDGAHVRTEIVGLDDTAAQLYAEPSGRNGLRLGGGPTGYAADWSSLNGAPATYTVRPDLPANPPAD